MSSRTRVDDRTPPATPSLALAARQGLVAGPRTKHVNAKVPPALFDAAAERLGTRSVSQVVTAGLAALAVEDRLGTWLLENEGRWKDLPGEVMESIEL